RTQRAQRSEPQQLPASVPSVSLCVLVSISARAFAVSTRALNLLGGNSCVVVLQRADAEAFLPKTSDRADGGGGAGERRDAGDLVHHRGAPDDAVVEERLAAERRVDHEIDLAIDD